MGQLTIFYYNMQTLNRFPSSLINQLFCFLGDLSFRSLGLFIILHFDDITH